jgi:hypothetical protein
MSSPPHTTDHLDSRNSCFFVLATHRRSMLSASTSRRRSWGVPGLNVPHRKIRVVFLSSLLAFGLLMVYLSPGDSYELQTPLQSGDGSPPMSSLLSARRLIRRASSPLIRRNRDDDETFLEAREGGDGNPFEAFRKGWPKLRDHRARGRDLTRRQQGGQQGGMTFDWYSITKLFVL